MTRTVAIAVFDEVEVLDACGPFEVFSVANRMRAREVPPGPPPFDVHTVAIGPERTIFARGGLELHADRTLDDIGPADIIIVPGGVTDAIERDPRLLDWLSRSAPTAEVTAAVCTGAFVLAEAGMLDGRAATTHWEDIAELQRRFPEVIVRDGVRFIDHGVIATSAGVSAGIDLSLHLVGRFEDEALARATARQMDYPWQP